jgi:CP family cyanate transporter-like MFS transporter
MGGNLSLALVVLTHLAPSPREASAYTGMAFLVGYLVAAAGPVALGTLTDATGGYRAPFLALAVFGVATTVVGVAAAAQVARHPASPPLAGAGANPG